MSGEEKHKKEESERSETMSESEAVKTETREVAPDGEALLEAVNEAREWRDKYLRLFAEFDNFRKRSKQEQSSLREFVAESLVLSLLPVMDDFNRLLSAPATDESLRRGIELIRNKLATFFELQGINEMEARGMMFDPERHDAIMMTPTKGFPAGTVLDVVTPGYVMGDRVIRHAQVIVSTEPKEDLNI